MGAMKHPLLMAALAGLFLISCKSEVTAKPAPARPALWKLADADTTIYLFGTVHVLPKGLAWRTKTLDAAIAKSDELVVEVADLDNPAATAGVFMKLALSPGLPPLNERVPEEKRGKLRALVAKSGVPLPLLDQMENWAVGISLAGAMLKDLDVSPDDGADSALTRAFKAAKKPVIGLETTEQQLGYFDTLSPTAQTAFLVSMVDDASDPKVEFAKMIGAWSKGDEKRIALSFDDELQMSEELVQQLLRQRNANWTRWIRARMDKPGTIFLAVGAGHLAGADSVQTMLAAQGLKTKRIQ